VKPDNNPNKMNVKPLVKPEMFYIDSNLPMYARNNFLLQRKENFDDD